MNASDREPGEPPDRDRRRTFAAVIAVEALVITALWFFSHYFGS